MTISAKLSDFAGLEFAVSDPTDTDNVGGFSDILNVIGAKTAKFSGGAIMKANAGLRIGLTQLKVVNVGGVARIGVVIRGVFVSTVSTGELVAVDFGNISLANIRATYQNNSQITGSTMELQVSTDDSIWVTVASSSSSALNISLNGGNQTYRFARLFAVTNAGVLSPQTIFEIAITSDVTINIRSSTTQDTSDGTILLSSVVVSDSTTVTFNTQLLLTGLGQFVTLEIVSFSGSNVDVNLSGITSIKEV